MTTHRLITLIDIGAERVHALQAQIAPGKIAVRVAAAWDRPAMPADRPRELGESLGGFLKESGFQSAPALLAVPRSDVVLKRLSLPIAGGVAPADLASIVHLQMSKQLTLAAEGTVIDYTTLAPESAGSSSLGVLAGAMPSDRYGWYREMARGAGLRVLRVGLRASGAAALLAELSQRRDGPTLGVVRGEREVEFLVVEQGQLVFARAADLSPPADADRVAVEAARTWAAFRNASAGVEAPTIAVLGSDPEAKTIAERVGKELDRPGEQVGVPSRVEWIAGSTPEPFLPLLGMLVEHAAASPTLDFAHPKRAVDRTARRRQTALLGVLGAILLVGGAGVWAMSDLSTLRSRLAASKREETRLRSELEQYLAEHARLNHFELWGQASVDWMAHLGAINQQLPDPREATLDEFGAALSTSVAFAGKGQYPDGAWEAKQSAVFSISGRAHDRGVAADLRGRLISSDQFARVETRGAELPDRFSLEMVTTRRDPDEAPPAPSRPQEGGRP